MNLSDTGPYEGYVYAYPHKTAYRPLSPRPALRDVWAGEDTSSLSLYVHVPFCEMRCGFCNLFTRTGAPEELVTGFLGALERQAEAVREAVPEARFSLGAIGGGTPTYLSAPELVRLFTVLTGTMGAALPGIPLSVETSPATATPDRLAVLKEFGATRVSIGVQSFDVREARAAGRPQKEGEVAEALRAIRSFDFETLNIDLIYGIDGQTRESWLKSVDTAAGWGAEEVYLYPLYVRPLTGLGRTAVSRADWDGQRLDLYRAGRDRLLELGYAQHSMRMFRRADAPPPPESDYTCQSDGMIGLGCGARSYTSSLHYSFDYAVSVTQVRTILDEYVTLARKDFQDAFVGRRLDEPEQKRRHLLQSLLQAEGLDQAAYRKRFGTEALSDFSVELEALRERGWLSPDGLRLTPEGLAWSDRIGPMLFSAETRELMSGYAVK